MRETSFNFLPEGVTERRSHMYTIIPLCCHEIPWVGHDANCPFTCVKSNYQKLSLTVLVIRLDLWYLYDDTEAMQTCCHYSLGMWLHLLPCFHCEVTRMWHRIPLGEKEIPIVWQQVCANRRTRNKYCIIPFIRTSWNQFEFSRVLDQAECFFVFKSRSFRL